jgi:hypothetical protein
VRGNLDLISSPLKAFSSHSKGSNPPRARLVKLYSYKVKAGQGREVTRTRTLYLFAAIKRFNI